MINVSTLFVESEIAQEGTLTWRDILKVSSLFVEIEIPEPPLFIEKTYTVYVGNTEIPNVYVGDNLITDISFMLS